MLVIVGGVATTFMLKALVAVCPAASVTRTLKLALPANVGVPVMSPVDDRESPGGKAPVASDHVYGARPPVAASDCE